MNKVKLVAVGGVVAVLAMSCKKKVFTSSTSQALRYNGSNAAVINPNPNAVDSLQSVIFIEKIDFLCDIEKERLKQEGIPEGYEYTALVLKKLKTISFTLTEKNAVTTHASLSEFLKESHLELYNENTADVLTLGKCTAVTEIGISFDQLTFEVEKNEFQDYIKSYPNYNLKVVNFFTEKPTEPRYFNYELEVGFGADFIYHKQ